LSVLTTHEAVVRTEKIDGGLPDQKLGPNWPITHVESWFAQFFRSRAKAITHTRYPVREEIRTGILAVQRLGVDSLEDYAVVAYPETPESSTLLRAIHDGKPDPFFVDGRLLGSVQSSFLFDGNPNDALPIGRLDQLSKGVAEVMGDVLDQTGYHEWDSVTAAMERPGNTNEAFEIARQQLVGNVKDPKVLVSGR